MITKQRLYNVIAKDLISYEISSIPTDQSVNRALELMEDCKCSHVAVVDNDVYQGIVSEEQMLDIENPEAKIGSLKLQMIKPCVKSDAHIYQVIGAVNEFSVSCIPVLDDENNFAGVISLQNLAKNFAQITNVNDPGGILILEVKNKDYSLAQAAQIVESDNAKILSSYIYSNGSSDTLDLVLKINKKDLSTIMSAFDRYDYIIRDSYHESKFEQDMQGRYDQFMNYLNM